MEKNRSNHEVTIVLFSRTFYEAKSIDEFPNNMRGYLQKDYLGVYWKSLIIPACLPITTDYLLGKKNLTG
ncbi:hypothetical protein HCN44_004825 [Aphidius gifuensis]|uniref:Uncharacterized protein n=1 Tax=Aphidius gifuensis TaxID=684658 RepID=A0A834XUK9_APHGI|nr:hypothetical protein HCN44_004825 [Aphidius gifuensis]